MAKMRRIASLVLCFVLIVRAMGEDFSEEVEQKQAQFSDDVVVADAVFRGIYVGVVRMIQRISDDSNGAPQTTILVRLKYAANDSTTENHMWHVEHDPVSGVDCALKNTHFAPFGITKQKNYTTYCSGITPDFCEVGDISTKTTLTSVGKDVLKLYSVPFLPVVGPWTVIGHSVNVHGGEKSKQRVACGNIALNKRMTSAREVVLPVKMPENFEPTQLTETRKRIAWQLGIRIWRVQTAVRLDTLGEGCISMKFLIFGRGGYDEEKLGQLREGKIDIGSLSPVSCTVSGKSVRRSTSERKTCGGDETEDDKGDREGRESENEDYEVVADAVFRGVYVGVVRMIQKVTSNADGNRLTTVIVRLKHAANDSTTDNHMWHVEHDPIANISCAANNKHYAPYGITKESNYTTYCSGNTPDYCELGDISGKTGLTSVGTNVVKTYSISLLPIVGPRTAIGHSVNVHGGGKSKVRQACGNILLNTKMTRAKFVDVPVKIPETWNDEDLVTARIKMSQMLGISLSKVHTAVRLDTLSKGCTKMQFLIFDRGTYCPDALLKLENADADIGPLSPTGCQFSRNSDATTPGNSATENTPGNGATENTLSKVVAVCTYATAAIFKSYI